MTRRVVSPVFVGRGPELAALAESYRAAIEAGPRTVLVTGDAGIGKSRLLSEFTARLDSEALLLTGRCVEFGTDGLAYAPFVSVMRRLVGVLDDPAAALPG